MNASRILRRVLGHWAFRIVTALVLIYGLFGFLGLPAILRSQLPKRLSAQLHREVTLAKARVNPFALSVTLEGFLVKDRDGSPFMGWDRLYVNLSSSTVFRGAPAFQEIRLEGFQARVTLDAKGEPNFQDLMEPSQEPAKPSGPPPEVRIDRLVVAGARVEFLDQQPRPPFATTLGPLSLQLDGFRLARDNRNPYAFTGSTERGERFGWQGQFSVDPVGSAGSFYIQNFYLPKYAPFYRDEVAFDILGGALDFKAAYELQWGEGRHVFRLKEGEAGLQGLALAERGQAQPAVVLPQVQARGLEADLLESRATLTSLLVKGLRLDVRRDAKGSVNLNRMAVMKEKPRKPDEKPFRFTLGELGLEDGALRFEDLGPKRKVALDLDQIALRLKGLSLEKDGTCELDAGLRWNGKGRLTAKGRLAPMKASGKLDLKAENLDLPPFTGYLEGFADVVMESGRLSGSGQVDFDAPREAYGYRGDARVDAFRAQDGPGREALAGWDALKITGIQVSTAPLTCILGGIDWEGPTGRYIMTPQGTSNVANARAAAPAAATPAKTTPMKAEIGGFRIKRGAFTFLDRSIQPVAALSLDAIEVQVGRLTMDPGARANLELKARVDGHAPVSAKGTLNLLSQAKYTQVALRLDGMDLSPLSPYAGKHLGYGIEKGKLGVDMTYLVEDTKLQGENRIKADQFTLGGATDSPDAVKLPVKLGLALLRDRHGVIDLDVPVRGDLAEPDFRLGKVIWRAILNVFAKIATSPFSLIGKAFGGGDADLSVLAFAPGSDTIDPAGLKTVEVLRKGLFERPGLRLDMEGSAGEAEDLPALRRQELDAQLARLKGASVTADDRPRWIKAAWLQAFPPPREKEKDSKAAPAPEPALPEMENQLLARVQVDAGSLKLLARRRVQAVRARLLEGGQVEEGRVFVAEGSERARKEGGPKVYFEMK
ncbi:MAG TPA: DUF748 domain-containing protein [Holophaga sp.]|nr:DUF748 domain-containing protein [Holophaga sp.]